MEGRLKTLYLQRSLTCIKNQSKICVSYTKILAQAYFLIDGLSDNLRNGVMLPPMFKQFVEKLEQQILKISEIISP